MKPRTSRAAREKKRLPIFTPLPQPDAGAGVPDIHPGAAKPDPEQRHALIAEAAYYRAERRGFQPGRELEDWCAAESEVDSVRAQKFLTGCRARLPDSRVDE